MFISTISTLQAILTYSIGDKMKISMIIPSINRVTELHDCINSLESQAVKPDEVVIIGHTNDEKTNRFVSNLKSDLNIEFLKGAGGTCKNRNLGIKYARGDVIIFIDDDTILHKDYIKNVKKIFEDNQINIVTGYPFDATDLINPLFVRKGDIQYILENSDDEFVKLIKKRVFQNLRVKYSPYNYILKMLRNSIKTLFLFEWPIKGKILASGYRSEMPDLKKINKMKKVEWVFGNNFAVRREVLNEFKFNEDLEIYPYVLNDDLEFSAKAGKKYDIFICSKLLLLHLHSPGGGGRVEGKKRFFTLVRSTYLIAKIKGNKVAHHWSVIGLLFGSIIKIPFSSSAISEIKGIIDGMKSLGDVYGK